MSDVINSIFGRAQNETPSSEGYGYGTAATETVDAAETETVEPAEDTTTETEDAVDETTDVDETADDAEDDTADSADEAEADEAEEASVEESDEAVTDEAAEDESDEDTDTDTADEAVAEETEAAEVAPVVVAAETETAEVAEEAGSRPAAGTRGSTTVADGVVSKIVIRVARKAEGVYELDEAGTSVEVDGEVATIAVTLVVEFGRAVKALAEQIRVQVVEAVEDYLGLEVASVDVHVADIHFPDAD